MTSRTPDNGQDVSSLDFDDSAWDSNDMMRASGDPEPEPLDDDDDDDDDQEQAVDAEGEEGDDATLEATDEDGDGDEDEAGPGDEENEDEDEEDELGAIDPPSVWPAQERQFFSQLPPSLQHAYMARAQAMTADYTRKTQALAQQRAQYQQIEQVISPHAQSWALNGMNPAQAIGQLIALSDMATKDPQGFIQYFANLRGVDLNQFGQRAENEYIDPQVAALRQPLAEVYSQVNQLKQEMQQREQHQAQAQYQHAFNTTHAAIDEFASRTGPDGKPMYPHFDEVVDTITAYVNAGVRDIDQAYRMACQANPQIAARIAARSRSNENVRRRREAEEARRASYSITGSIPSNGSLPTSDMSVRDLLLGAYRGDVA